MALACLCWMAENDGSVFSQGVGISNIRNRLQGIYSLKHKLIFSNADSGGLIVTVGDSL